MLYEINSLSHSGIKGMRWGRRRYQNQDGSLTPMGRQHYGVGNARGVKGMPWGIYGNSKDAKRYLKAYKRAQRTQKAIDRTYNRQERDLYDARALANERGMNQAYREWDGLNNRIFLKEANQDDKEWNDRVRKYGADAADDWYEEYIRRDRNPKKRRTKKFAADWVDRKAPTYADEEYSRLYDKIGDRYADTRSRMTTMRNRAQDTVDYYEPRAYGYDRRIEKAYNMSLAKAQKKYDRQQFASRIGEMAAQRLTDAAIDAAVNLATNKIKEMAKDDSMFLKKSTVSDFAKNTKKRVNSPKQFMTEAKLAPSYKNLYNRLKKSGRVTSFNQFLNEIYYPDLERRR